MKLATWNVNSLKVRLSQVLDFLAVHKPDVLCLQETKMEDANFPVMGINAAGYRAVFSGQKTYNGVAILSPKAPQEVTMGIADFNDPQKRVISAVIDGVRVICVYIPNGESVTSVKYGYKLDWLRRLNACLRLELEKYPRLAIWAITTLPPKIATCTIPNFGREKCCLASRRRRHSTNWSRSACAIVFACSISPRNLSVGGIIGRMASSAA